MTPGKTASFGPDLFPFLRDLSRHNDRTWFAAQKARYVGSVLAPAVRFVEEVGPRLTRISEHITYDARPFGGSVLRIYRDTRFSKDKSPYKNNVSIHFTHERAAHSDEHLPGYLLHLSPGESHLASGIWHPSPPALKQIRDAIVGDPAGWAKVRKASPPEGGESAARVPAGYDPDSKFAEDLRRKDFFIFNDLTDAEVTSSQFADHFVASCKGFDPLNRFLANATHVPW